MNGFKENFLVSNHWLILFHAVSCCDWLIDTTSCPSVCPSPVQAPEFLICPRFQFTAFV